MSIYKTLTIDDKQVTFAASAAVPRLYRCRFNRDLFHDLKTLGTASDGKSYDVESLEVFENVAYIMAKAADRGKDAIPDTPEEWLESFNMFSIYEVLPELLDMWNISTRGLQNPKGRKPSSTAR